jgi:hypothetical protein
MTLDEWVLFEVLTVFIGHLHMQNEQFVLVPAARLDEILQNPVERVTAADGGLRVAFAALADGDHHCCACIRFTLG